MMRGYGYGTMMDGWGWAGWFGMVFFGFLLLAGLVLLVIWAVRSMSGGHDAGTPAMTVHGGVVGPRQDASMPMPQQQPGQGRDEAVDIVRRRYAAGEITKEQYDEMMRGLEAGPG